MLLSRRSTSPLCPLWSDGISKEEVWQTLFFWGGSSIVGSVLQHRNAGMLSLSCVSSHSSSYPSSKMWVCVILTLCRGFWELIKCSGLSSPENRWRWDWFAYSRRRIFLASELLCEGRTLNNNFWSIYIFCFNHFSSLDMYSWLSIPFPSSRFRDIMFTWTR